MCLEFSTLNPEPFKLVVCQLCSEYLLAVFRGRLLALLTCAPMSRLTWGVSFSAFCQKVSIADALTASKSVVNGSWKSKSVVNGSWKSKSFHGA